MNRLALQLAVSLGGLLIFAGSGDAARLTPAQRADLFAHVSPARVQADTDGNTLFDDLEAMLAATRADQRLEVIVRYKAGHEGAAGHIAGRVTRHLKLDRSVVARLRREEIRHLAASGAVESIEANTICYATRDTAEASFGTAKASVDFGYTGDGDGAPNTYSPRDLTIAVIDTGIDGKHPDFAGGKIIAWRDFTGVRTQNKAGAYDDVGHGTHVASIAAGAVRNGVGGVAPGASLIGLKVLSPDGKGSASGDNGVIANAVDWCTGNRDQYGIDVINLSLSGTQRSDGTDALSRAVDRASAAGLVVCVAAGNEGPGAYTISSPAAATTAITVGNMRDLGEHGFALALHSSRGPTADGRVKPDLCGPGVHILAAKANTGGYVSKGGTSMSCPFVAGVAALMLQANPSLSPNQVKTILKETAVHFGPGGENNEFGAGRLDAYAALAAIAGGTGTAPEVPDHLYREGSLAGKEDRQTVELSVDDIRFPVAVTLIMRDKNTDFDLRLYDADNNLVAQSVGMQRQETLKFHPARPGTYFLQVSSYAGAGSYSLDISAGLSGQ
jgi:serine protease AprX